MIDGVSLHDLLTHSDGRGFFREIVRHDQDVARSGLAQWSHSLMFDGVVKAWHYHRKQYDIWYVVSGVLRVGMADMRPDSPTYKQTMDLLMGDYQPPRILRIPPGVAHGCKTVQGPVHLFYLTSETYDPDDELRLPYNTPEIDFDWLAGPEIK